MDKLSPQIEPCLNQFQLPPLQKLLLMLPARSRTDRLEFHLLFPQLDCGENLQGKSRARGLKGLPACWKEACYKCQWSVPSLSQKNSLGFKFCLFWFHTVSEDEENASGLGPIVRLPPPPAVSQAASDHFLSPQNRYKNPHFKTITITGNGCEKQMYASQIRDSCLFPQIFAA